MMNTSRTETNDPLMVWGCGGDYGLRLYVRLVAGVVDMSDPSLWQMLHFLSVSISLLCLLTWWLTVDLLRCLALASFPMLLGSISM